MHSVPILISRSDSKNTGNQCPCHSSDSKTKTTARCEPEEHDRHHLEALSQHLNSEGHVLQGLVPKWLFLYELGDAFVGKHIYEVGLRIVYEVGLRVHIYIYIYLFI